MEQTQDGIMGNLAERLWWELAQRHAARVARRLYHQATDGGCIGSAIHRQMVPFV